MDEERKARVNAQNSKKKIEMDIADLEEQLEAANRVKEDGLRQLKKYQQQVKDIQRDLDEARLARDEISEQAKENEKKAKQLEADYLQMQEVKSGRLGITFKYHVTFSGTNTLLNIIRARGLREKLLSNVTYVLVTR